MGRVLLVVAVLAVATAFGLWWRARQGRYTAVAPSVLSAAATAADVGAPDRITAADLGVTPASGVTFVQFSSEVCTPCRRTAVVLAQIAAERPGVSHVELDVEEHLDLVRRFGVMRTPTTLLVDAAGVVVGRLSGAADRRHALAALDSCLGGVTPA